MIFSRYCVYRGDKPINQLSTEGAKNLMNEMSYGILRRSSGSPIFTVLCVEVKNTTGSRWLILIIWSVMTLVADWASYKEEHMPRERSDDTKDVTFATLWKSTRECTVFIKLSKLVDFCQAELSTEATLVTLTGFLSFPIYTTLITESWTLANLTERFLWEIIIALMVWLYMIVRDVVVSCSSRSVGTM